MTTVLVVDDDPDMRFLAKLALEQAGFDVRDVDSGLAALASLERDPIVDLVLLDVQMPDLDGWETLRRLRAGPATDVPVVFVTVKAHRRDKRLAWSSGADGYVVKPYTVASLGPFLAEVVARTPEERVARRAAELALLPPDP